MSIVQGEDLVRGRVPDYGWLAAAGVAAMAWGGASFFAGILVLILRCDVCSKTGLWPWLDLPRAYARPSDNSIGRMLLRWLWPDELRNQRYACPHCGACFTI